VNWGKIKVDFKGIRGRDKLPRKSQFSPLSDLLHGARKSDQVQQYRSIIVADKRLALPSQE
jgi:hypothetical protein